VTWRRERALWVWLLLALLLFWTVVLFVGGLADGDFLSIAIGLAFGGGSYLLYKWREPAVVVFHIRPSPNGGTEVVIEGEDGLSLSSIVRSTIAATSKR
jgi:hypothetical protein